MRFSATFCFSVTGHFHQECERILKGFFIFIPAGDGASKPAPFITRSLITPYDQREALGEKANTMSDTTTRTSITDAIGNFLVIPKEFTKNSRTISDQGRWLFVLLREYTNGESQTAFPSYETIRERTGWTRKTISKAIKDLEAHGWLAKHRAFGGVNNYVLGKITNSPKPELLKTAPIVPNGNINSSQRVHQEFPAANGNKNESNKNESNKIESSLSKRAKNARSTEGKGTSLQIVKQLDPFDTDFGLPEMESPIVHAIVCDAHAPEVAQPPTSPDAQATLRTPHAQAALVNPELGEIKPKADLAGITASAEAVEPPSTPVSAKSSARSRKPKTEKTPEEIKISAGVVELMNFIGEKMGKIPNAGGQGKACKEMLKAGYPIERIKQELEIQLGELLKGRRRLVTWLTVQQTITSSVYAEQHKSNGGSNGKSNFDDFDLDRFCQSYGKNHQGAMATQ